MIPMDHLMVMANNTNSTNHNPDRFKSQWEWRTVSWDMKDPEFKFAFCGAVWDIFVIWMIWASYGYLWGYFWQLIYTWNWATQFAFWNTWFLGYWNYWYWAF